MIRKISILFFVVILVACSGKEQKVGDSQHKENPVVQSPISENSDEKTEAEIKIERVPVDIYYVYTMPRSTDCKAVENLTREIVAEHFVKSDSVRFTNINIHDKQYEDVIKKYDISTNTLIVTNGDTIADFTELAMQKARSNPYQVIREMKEEINKQAYP